MPKHLDFTGRKVGNLLALYPIKAKRNINWACVCVCGAETIVRASRLNKKETVSCGCRGQDAKLNELYREYKRSATIRNYSFKLSKKLFKMLISSPCYYCERAFEKYIGVDRVDNDKGYIDNNVVSCCYECNKIKWDCFTVEETKVMVKALLNYRDSK